MKLSDFDTRETSNSGVFMPLLHPKTKKPLKGDDGKDTGITLLGRDSDEYDRLALERSNTLLKATLGGMKNGNANGGDVEDAMSAEETRKHEIELAVACTVNWQGMDDFPCPPTPQQKNADAKALYEKHPWVREQAVKFIGERENFFPKSVTN